MCIAVMLRAYCCVSTQSFVSFYVVSPCLALCHLDGPGVMSVSLYSVHVCVMVM